MLQRYNRKHIHNMPKLVFPHKKRTEIIQTTEAKTPAPEVKVVPVQKIEMVEQHPNLFSGDVE